LAVASENFERNAVFSPNRRYRYLLTCRFGAGPSVLFVMLNPSQADENVDDPTIRRCIGFARREGFGKLEVANLYGYRTSDPDELFNEDDPVGIENDIALEQAVIRADGVVVAWGNHADPGRVAEVSRILTSKSNNTVQCFGLTQHGQPRHPLYLPADAELMAFLST